MKVIKFLICITLLIPLTSCYFNRRLVYLQDKGYSELTPTLIKSKKQVYRLQPADVLSVQVKSSTETEASNTIFNVATREGGLYATPGSLFLEGYTVGITGNINLPIIGEVMVKDL